MSTTALSCTAGDIASWDIAATDATTGSAFSLTGWDAYLALSDDTLGSPVLVLSNTGGAADGITMGTATGTMTAAMTPQQTAALELDVYECSVYVMPTGSTLADSPDTRTLLSGTLSVERVARGGS